jgi:hypothetical protein
MFARVGDPLLEWDSERVSEAAYGVLTLRETSGAGEPWVGAAIVEAGRRDSAGAHIARVVLAAAFEQVRIRGIREDSLGLEITDRIPARMAKNLLRPLFTVY